MRDALVIDSDDAAEWCCEHHVDATFNANWIKLRMFTARSECVEARGPTLFEAVRMLQRKLRGLLPKGTGGKAKRAVR